MPRVSLLDSIKVIFQLGYISEAPTRGLSKYHERVMAKPTDGISPVYTAITRKYVFL
jgi:hypothetical protein